MAQVGSRQVTMENQRQRPHSLLVSSQWASLGIGSIPPDVNTVEEMSRKAEQIVNRMLNSPSSNPPREELLTLTTITEQETPLASPTNDSEYPTQELLHPLNATYITVGPDDKYFPMRDYYLNDVGKLGQGGFGTCLCACDNTTDEKFVIKRNSKSEDDKIQSIRKESAILSTLHHENIVFFYGAVLDTYPSNIRNCNMMMELAENGALSGLLIDESGGPLPLCIEQSLYYLGQILQGVFYLHNNSVMHLDIKTPNVLVFNSGKTVKLADFGTSVTYNGSVLSPCRTGVSPLYAAPEIVREESPRFTSDVWSALCVFVELITAKLPWCFRGNIENFNHAIFMVGQYSDNIEEIVPVKQLHLEEDIVDLFRSIFKKDHKERPAAMALVEMPLFLVAQEYEKYFDGYVDEPDDQGVESNILTGQDLCADRIAKMSVTSSAGATDDSGIEASIYGQQSSWLSAHQCNGHMQEESPLPSPVTQSFSLGNSQTHSAPSSISSQRPNQRRFSLGITSTRLDPDVEYDRAAKCKAVQRSVSFSEAYVVRGPEIDLPLEDYHPSSARYPPVQTRQQNNQHILNSLVPSQYHHIRLQPQQRSPQQSSLLIQSDQLNQLSQSNQNTKKPEMKAPESGSADGTRLMNFKFIV